MYLIIIDNDLGFLFWAQKISFSINFFKMNTQQLITDKPDTGTYKMLVELFSNLIFILILLIFLVKILTTCVIGVHYSP